MRSVQSQAWRNILNAISREEDGERPQRGLADVIDAVDEQELGELGLERDADLGARKKALKYLLNKE